MMIMNVQQKNIDHGYLDHSKEELKLKTVNNMWIGKPLYNTLPPSAIFQQGALEATMMEN